MWSKFRRDEEGQALIIALILMLLGGLIIAPVLSYVGSGLIIGKDVHEKRMAELYAADAGVEDGLWYLQDIERLKSLIQNLYSSLDPADPDYYNPGDWGNWKLTDYPWATRDIDYEIADDINGKDIDVTMDYLAADKTFKVTSVGKSADSSTTIDAYASGLNFSDLLQNVITSQSGYTLQGPTTVTPGEGEEHGPVANYGGDWPTRVELAAWYWDDVKNETPYDSDTINVTNTPNIGPLYQNGNLAINKTGGGGGGNALLTLQNTVYVTGELTIGTTNQNFTLNLNGQTIFVESDVSGSQDALKIGVQCTIIGSGCIIAVGDIEFKPNLNCSPDDYILVLSVVGKTYMQPNGDFYGTLAGSSEVHIQNGDAYWNDPSDKDFNFPTGDYMDGELIIEISAWEISLD
jgi:hypothetical protein